MRIGQVIQIPEENVAEYKKLHADCWEGVKRMIYECNIRNYSIYYRNGQLFAYMEYIGEDFDGDMAKMAADPTTQKWWDVCKPLQTPYADRKDGEWWCDMEEVFHKD